MNKLFALLCVLLMGVAYGSAFVTPPLAGGVNDYAHLIDESLEVQLSEALKDIYSQGGPQLAVLTVDSLQGFPIEDASMQVVKSWKLGTEAKDNGILLLIAKNDRKVRIEVGQGVEGDLTDAYSRRIIDNIIVPHFRRGDFSSGILMGVDGILQRMSPPIHLDEYLGKSHFESSSQGQLTWLHILIFIIIIIVLSQFNSPRFYGGGGWGGGFGGDSFGGGSGGWSGGGGGFSGGGSSGSW